MQKLLNMCRRLLSQHHWSQRIRLLQLLNLPSKELKFLEEQCLKEEGQQLTDVSTNVVTSGSQGEIEISRTGFLLQEIYP